MAIETSALRGPSAGRGLGRYTSGCLEAAARHGFAVVPIVPACGPAGRLTEWLAVADRTLRLRRMPHDLFHVTHPHAWGWTDRPTVVTVHDLLALDAPSYRRLGIKARVFFALAAAAEQIICVSEFTAERLTAHFPRAAGRISVVPTPPAAAFRPPGHENGASSREVLALVDMATPDPRKRAAWLAPLARRLAALDLKLVVAGAGSDAPSQVATIAPARGIGRVSDEELWRRLTASLCFVYLSAYEGQGLPPLEAMASGTPVIVIRNTAVGEVVADGGLLLDDVPGSWEQTFAATAPTKLLDAIATACSALHADTEHWRAARARALARAATFSGERFAQGLETAYRLALERARLRRSRD